VNRENVKRQTAIVNRQTAIRSGSATPINLLTS